tara:strand:+ start:7611 stop:7883 length:273 start_codon:yes stop_codon:yes gene_type:complete
MLKPEDIKPGKSYACKFKAEMMLDIYGRPPGLSDTPLAGPGWYESFGLITIRDMNTKLFKITDLEGEAKGKTYTVPFDQCWDIDEANLVK